MRPRRRAIARLFALAGLGTVASAGVLALAAIDAGCSSGRSEGGVEVASLPPDVRSDYATFARRCSKCHSLARPLSASIVDDEYWREYVERMRRQPASDITRADAESILRFLHYWSHRDRHPRESEEERSP